MTKKHKHKHKSEHHAPPHHKPLQIYQDIGKPRSKRFLPLVFALLAFSSIGAYLLYQSYAATTYYSYVTVNVRDLHRGDNNSYPIAGMRVNITRAGGAAADCWSGSNRNFGNTNANGQVAFYCSNGGSEWYGHQFTFGTGVWRDDNTHGGYVANSVFSLRGSPSCPPTNPASCFANNLTHYMHSDYDGDGVWGHDDRCITAGGPSASGGCPAPKIDFVASPSSVGYNGSTKLTWSASYMFNNCSVGANPANSQWSTGVAPSGSKTITGLTKSTTFSLVCSNGLVSSRSVGVTVGAAPAPPPPTTSPAPSAPRTSSTPRTTGARAATRPAVQSSPQVQSDKSPPSTPTDFTAVQEGREVKFTWGASTDNVGVSSYKLERSTDETNWSTLDENITDTNYTDDTFSFDTKYFYRIAAYDAAGNGSEYVQLDITTGPFDASALEQPFSIESEDRLIKIEFEGGTFDKEALCEVFLTDESRNKFGKVAIGPYKVVCKDKEGTEITEFKKPANVRMSAPEGVNISKVEVYALVNDEAQNVNSTLNEQRDAQLFTLDKPTIFAGVEKSSSKWWIGPIIIIPLAILAYLLWRLRQRRLAESQTYSQDYAAPYPATTYEQQPTQPEQPVQQSQPPITSHEYPWTNEDDTQQRQ